MITPCCRKTPISLLAPILPSPVAKQIYQTAINNGKRAHTFGGAKNHCLVMPDADIEQAAEAIVGAAYGSAGERCMAVSVAVAIGDEVVEFGRGGGSSQERGGGVVALCVVGKLRQILQPLLGVGKLPQRMVSVRSLQHGAECRCRTARALQLLEELGEPAKLALGTTG